MDAMRYLFVGERPSERSVRMGKTWKDGVLAAKPLFRALEACGISPHDVRQCEFINCFNDDGSDSSEAKMWIAIAYLSGYRIVAMGRKVEKYLQRHNMPHTFIYHPAARGKIRGTEAYIEHVRQALSSRESEEADA